MCTAFLLDRHDIGMGVVGLGFFGLLYMYSTLGCTYGRLASLMQEGEFLSMDGGLLLAVVAVWLGGPLCWLGFGMQRMSMGIHGLHSR